MKASNEKWSRDIGAQWPVDVQNAHHQIDGRSSEAIAIGDAIHSVLIYAIYIFYYLFGYLLATGTIVGGQDGHRIAFPVVATTNL